MSYLGYRGYTVLKKDITASEQEKIRNELTIAPKNQMPGFAKLPAYPIYRVGSWQWLSLCSCNYWQGFGCFKWACSQLVETTASISSCFGISSSAAKRWWGWRILCVVTS